MRKALMMFGTVALLTACGGGGGSAGGNAGVSNLTIQGVAATGAAISGGTVDVKCKNGTGTATTNGDGTYSVTVTDGAQPCILRAVDPVTKVALYSIVESGGTTANITPVTSLVVANALGDTPSTAFSSFNSSVHDKITSSGIATAVARIQAATAAIGSDADMTGVDIMKGTFNAATENTSGDANDKKIDALMAALAASDKKITDLSEQLKTATTNNAAASGITGVVGDSKYSLANCPYARSGDIWAINFAGLAPVSYNVDFNNMVLKRISDNSTSAINFKRDSSSNAIPCAFTSNINGTATEFRVSEGGIGAWTQLTDFGLIVPVQKTKMLTDATFAGSYPALAFIREKTQGFRTAIPIRYEIDTNGDIKGYTCDMTKSKPDCLTSVDTSSADSTTCNAQSNGTFACTSSAGLVATGILYATGSQATMFMSITNMNVGVYRFGGLIVMNKAAKSSLPKVGATSAANSSWYTGVNPSSNTVVSGGTSAGTVESVDASTNSYTTTSAGSTTVYTRYIDTPASGLSFSKAQGVQGVSLSSQSGWSVSMLKTSGTEFDGWATYIRAKR